MGLRFFGAATALAAMLSVTPGAGALAQGLLFNNNYGGYDPYRDYYVALTVWRVGMMVVATAAGFFLGWFLSPQAREFRRLIMLGLFALGVLAALFNHGVIGWGAAFIISLAGFMAGVGFWLGRVAQKLLELPSTFGSSRWADAEHMHERGMFKEGGLLLGEAFDGMKTSRFAYHGDKHALTIAPTRKGKGVSHIVPNVLQHNGSVIVIDIKGENALITAKARQAMGQEVRLYDPWNIAAHKLGMEPSRYNPMDWLKLSDIDAPENAMILADAMVMDDGKGEAFWREEAKAIIQGVMLHVAFDAAFDGVRHLGTVRDLLLGDADQLAELFQAMAKSPHAVVASTGSRCLQKDPKLLSNVLASTQAEMHFMDKLGLTQRLVI